jgi:hypothetical protein
MMGQVVFSRAEKGLSEDRNVNVSSRNAKRKYNEEA